MSRGISMPSRALRSARRVTRLLAACALVAGVGACGNGESGGGWPEATGGVSGAMDEGGVPGATGGGGVPGPTGSAGAPGATGSGVVPGAMSDGGAAVYPSGEGGTIDAMVPPVVSGTDGGMQSACQTTFPVPGSVPAATRKVKDLTGTAGSSGQFGVGGTDLGIPVRQPDGKIAYIFGDTFEQDGVGGPGWRAPVLLRSDPGLGGNGINFNGAAGGQYAKQILNYSHNNQVTWLPSDAITIGGRMYLHYMVNQGLGNVQWTQIAYSDDNGENWSLSNARWEANENNSLRQLWTWERGCDGYVYALSTKFSRDSAIILHRVPEAQILDRNAYEPWGWDGTKWAWGNPATIVLDGSFGEMSLRRVEDKWVLAWFNAGSYEITIKVFDSPTSDLHTATTYHPIAGGDWCAQNDTTVAQLYGGYIHPDSTLHDLHLIVSQWNTSTGTCHTVQDWPYHAMEFVTGVQ